MFFIPQRDSVALRPYRIPFWCVYHICGWGCWKIPATFSGTPPLAETGGAVTSRRNNAPTAEQRQMLAQLIASKLPGMMIEELRELYNAATKIIDKRKAAPDA